MRLNIGAGAEVIDGFESVDLIRVADHHWRMDALQVGDGEVDEIRSVHSLEHVGTKDVAKVLAEWHRALRTGGKLTVEVPDLDYVCRFWLSRENPDWAMELLFGNQAHPGEYHMTGFDENRLRLCLAAAGFELQSFRRYWSHGQDSLEAICVKP